MLCFVGISKSFASSVAPEGEILTFKQRVGESLKDAWYRIKNSQDRATKKQSTTILLRNFYVGITSWHRFVLDTAIGGNFLEAPVWEALNIMENLIGIPPIVEIKDDITLAHIMSKLENIELKMPSMSKINEVDRIIQGNLNRLDSSMHKNYKTLETLKSHDVDPSRIDKIEDIIETLGTTLSSIKTKKVETPARKGPKFVHVPKVPQPKTSIPIAKGVETVKTLEEIPLLNRIRNEIPIGLTTFAFVPRSVATRPFLESPLKTSCTIEELFDDLYDGSIDTT